MNSLKILFLVAVIGLFVSSCSKETEDNEEFELTGTWVQYVDDGTQPPFTIIYEIFDNKEYSVIEKDENDNIEDSYGGTWKYDSVKDVILFRCVIPFEDENGDCISNDIGHFFNGNHSQFFIEYEDDDDGIIEFPFVKQK